MSTFLALVLIACAFPPASAQKRVVQGPIIAHYYNVPSTLEGLTTAAEAVVVAQVLLVRDLSTLERPLTEYDMRMVQQLKGHPKLNERFSVCQSVGTVETAEQILTRFDPDLPRFTVQAEYLLFLRWDEGSDCFWPVFGPSSVATLTADGTVSPLVNHPALKTLKGVKKADLAARLAATRRP